MRSRLRSLYGESAGNLSSQVKESRYLEQFAYDSLNRLTESRLLSRNGQAVNELTLSHGYDALGNVCSKNGVAYAYGIGSGCGGASGLAAMSQASPADAFDRHPRAGGDPVSSTPIPRNDPRAAVTARNLWQARAVRAMRGVQFAPENRYRRYSDDDDAPSWAHEDDAWGLNDAPSSLRFWVARPKSRPARAPSTFGPASGASRVVAAAQPPGPDGNPLIPPPKRPHAVVQTGSGTSATVYAYGLHGNQVLRDAPGTAEDRTIRYSLDDKPHEIQMGSGAVERFWYGPDGQRYKRSRDAAKLYIGNVEVVLQGGVATYKRYIGGIAIQVVTGGAVQSTRFLFHDHLGSVVRIANADGSVAEGLDYAAFGERRSTTDPHGSGAPSTVTPRGYTGHEMLDGTGVVHMNGRIYDAGLGRFLQADPVIQAPNDAQSWNAYSYVFNNPLRYTDPTGMMADGLRQFLGVVVMMVGMYFFPAGAQWWVQIAYGAAVGAASGYVATGTTQGAVRGAFTGALTAGLNFAAGYYGWGDMARIGAQAVSGGIMESLQGGNFGNGFVAAGMTAAFTAGLGNVGNTAVRTAMGAIIGGSLSEATGGKFANGAISGAMQAAMMGGEESSSHSSPDGGNGNSLTTKQYTELKAEFTLLEPQLNSIQANSPQATADEFGAAALPFTKKWGFEIGANIVGKGRNFHIENVTLGYFGGVTIPRNTMAIADIHTHPAGGGDGFSGAVMYNKAQGLRIYDGDLRSNFIRRTDGYAYRVGGGFWRFNQSSFRSDLAGAMETGTTIDARWSRYVEKIR